MGKRIAHVSILVADYDEAIAFYVKKLGFIVIEDTILSASKRWVLIAPEKDSKFCLLLALAANNEQQKFIGNQSGGRVFLFLNTDNFWMDYKKMLAEGIKFTREPNIEPYGIVAVFEDLYGNLWDLIEPATEE